jgi:hypothetical protein
MNNSRRGTMQAMPQAHKVREVDFLHPDGWREVHIVWRLPNGGYKARLSLLNRQGERRAGYDWHHGKSAHRHYRGEEAPYRFTNVDRLLADFARDVEKVKEEEKP